MSTVINFEDLRDKVVLISGSNGNLGRKLIEIYSRNAKTIIAHCRETSSEFELYLNEMRNNYNVSIHSFEHDFHKNPELPVFKAFFDSIQIKKIDILINNAGVFDNSIIEMTTNQDLDEYFNINFISQLKFIKILIKFMKKSEDASIINLSSNASIELNVGDGVYGISKLAINGLTKVLSKELSTYRIRVNAVAPGLMDSDWSERIGSRSSQEFINQSSLGRLIQLEEIANVILFLSSKFSIAINGQVIICDGGR